MFFHFAHYDSGWAIIQFADESLQWKPISLLSEGDESSSVFPSSGLNLNSKATGCLEVDEARTIIYDGLADRTYTLVVDTIHRKGDACVAEGEIEISKTYFPMAFQFEKKQNHWFLSRFMFSGEDWHDPIQFSEQKRKVLSRYLSEVVQTFLLVRDSFGQISA